MRSELSTRCVIRLLCVLAAAMQPAAGSAQPCTTDADCNDVNECTDDVCVADLCENTWILPPDLEPVQPPIPMRTTSSQGGEIVEGSSLSAHAVQEGVHLAVETSGLRAGHGYTMWLLWFDEPENCESLTVPDGLLCGLEDLARPETGFNSIYGGGFVATGGIDRVESCLLAGIDLDPDDPYERDKSWPPGDGRLDRPLDAEYQTVLLYHGPADPDYMPPRWLEEGVKTQIEKHDGGCTATLDGPYTCGGEQSAGAFSRSTDCNDPLNCPQD